MSASVPSPAAAGVFARPEPGAPSGAVTLRARDHLLGFALAAGYLGVLLATASDLGMARDEGIYVHAAELLAGWLELLVREPSAALAAPAIDHAFGFNREHPPLMKLLSAIGYLAHRELGVFASDSTAFRSAGMLSAALLVWLIFAFGCRLWGRGAGVFAALSFALLPRPFYHAHLNAFDVPITLMTCAVIYAYLRSLTSRRWAIVTGVAFGIALLTKHNSWFVPGICAIHFAIVAWLERRWRACGGAPRVERLPLGLIAMLVLGPLITYAAWPYLWRDPLERYRWYAAFHVKHAYYNMEYFGVNYFWPPFPMSYAWVMTFFTVPLTTLALGLAGLAHELKHTGRDLWAFLRPSGASAGARVPRSAPDATQRNLLLFGAMLAPLVVMSVPTTPIFGGTKHWFPAYPFLALFAARAFVRVVEVVRARVGRRPWARATPLALGAYCLAPALVETAHSHPFGLSHYTIAAGGVPGAAAYGMNRQFWGFTTRSLVPYLREALPNGGSVYICDTIYTAWQMLIRDGLLPDNLRATGDIARADYALVHHEKHFAEVDHQIWTTYGSVQPVHVLEYDGVPIISVYKNPRR